MVEHTKVSNAEYKFMQKIILGVMVAVPQQVASNVTELQ